MPYQLRVLGPPEVLDEGGRTVSLSLGKPLALLIYVASNPSPVSRDELADLFWPDADRQKGRHSVRQALWVLKNALGEEIFQDQDPLSLTEGSLDVDLHLFSHALTEGRVEDACSLWRGPVLEHFGLAGARSWNRWVEDLRADLERRFSGALLRHARDQAERGNAEGSLRLLDQAIDVAPSSPAPHLARVSLLMDLLRLDRARDALAQAHHTLGDQEDVLRQLQALEERLDREVVDQRMRLAEAESFPMEFVGRSREMAGLHTLWREVERGLSRVAVVDGPSGIGKTRLAQELLGHVSGEEMETVTLRGTRGEKNLRWGVVSDLIRRLLRLPGSAGISTASDSLLRAMIPSIARDQDAPSVANGFNPAAVLDAVMDLLESVTFEVPLAVVVDDFQWVDPESRTLLVGLANRCRQLRVLFLYLGRSDLSSRHWERVEDALVADADARHFVLGPLIEEEVGELLALGATFRDSTEAAAVVSKIHQASAGNPLFIREILGELREQGVLRRGETGWVFEVSAIPNEFELPENIRNLLKERMARMSQAAATVAATLAQARRALSAETLKTRAHLPAQVFTEAVAELLEKGIVEWADGTRLDFVHDLLRETAATHLKGYLERDSEGERRRWGARGILVLAAGVLFALPLSILWGIGDLPRQSRDHRPPYGGGVIVLQTTNSGLLALEPDHGPPSEWTFTDMAPPDPSAANKVFRGQGGELVWFGIRDSPQGPDLLRILDDGTELPLFAEAGDQALTDLSPDGSRILFISENTDELPFSHSLFRGWLEEGRKELIHRGTGRIPQGIWSRDGDLISFIAWGLQDTLFVFSRQKEQVASVVLDNIFGITWCGGSLVTSAMLDQEGFFLRLSIPSMEVDTLARIDPGAVPTCSPDGTGLVYMGVLDRHLVPLLLDLETGEVNPLPTAGHPIQNLRWLPAVAPPVPRSLDIEKDTLYLKSGEEARPSVSVLMSDGSRSAEEIRWESLDPGIAAVRANGQVTGNGAGRAEIVASWGYSLRDTLIVEVEVGDVAGTILRDEFDELDTLLWIPMGLSPGIDRAPDGQSALRLVGREKYSDGLVLSSPVSLEQGITVEVEFLMTPNRPVHQNIAICILDMEPDRDMLRSGKKNSQAGACVQYPGQELEKFDIAEASVSVNPGRIHQARVPNAFPTDDWTHLALQIRADGEATLVVNRRRIVSNPIVLPTRPRTRWTVVLQGDAIGTDLFLRNLAIWPGERY